MQVRVFESKDMASGLKMIKKELGPDALILSTKTVRNNRLGILGKPTLEITAAIDSDHTVEGQPKRVDEPVKHSPRFEDEENNAPLFSFEPQKPQVEDRCDKAPDNSDELKNEVSELKELVQTIAGRLEELTNSPANRDRDARSETAPLYDDHLQTGMAKNGINIETARTISQFLRETMTEDELSDQELLCQQIIHSISPLIEVSRPEFEQKDKQHRLALLGPTGVGKTTTLAKIAASYITRHSSSVALITVDTYRIAAVEQLKVYGEIMHLPVEVVITPEQMEEAIEKHNDKELILIDTAGRSPRDPLAIEELSAFFPPELQIEKHLVLSASTREDELLDTLAQFNTLNICNTIFTKIDECSNLGVLLNIQLQSSCPLSYITNGQRVPEDIIDITPEKAAELIMSHNQGSMYV